MGAGTPGVLPAPGTLPRDNRLHCLLVALLGVQVQVNAPLHAKLWDDQHHMHSWECLVQSHEWRIAMQCLHTWLTPYVGLQVSQVKANYGTPPFSSGGWRQLRHRPYGQRLWDWRNHTIWGRSSSGRWIRCGSPTPRLDGA